MSVRYDTKNEVRDGFEIVTKTAIEPKKEVKSGLASIATFSMTIHANEDIIALRTIPGAATINSIMCLVPDGSFNLLFSTIAIIGNTFRFHLVNQTDSDRGVTIYVAFS